MARSVTQCTLLQTLSDLSQTVREKCVFFSEYFTAKKVYYITTEHTTVIFHNHKTDVFNTFHWVHVFIIWLLKIADFYHNKILQRDHCNAHGSSNMNNVLVLINTICSQLSPAVTVTQVFRQTMMLWRSNVM